MFCSLVFLLKTDFWKKNYRCIPAPIKIFHLNGKIGWVCRCVCVCRFVLPVVNWYCVDRLNYLIGFFTRSLTEIKSQQPKESRCQSIAWKIWDKKRTLQILQIEQSQQIWKIEKSWPANGKLSEILALSIRGENCNFRSIANWPIMGIRSIS